MPCLKCGKAGELRCSRCQLATYCSAICQRSDWAVHKRACVAPVSKTPKFTFPLEHGVQMCPDGRNENVLLLLHGFGDSCVKFLEFGKKLNLPQTMCLAMSGPCRVPLHTGCAWFPMFDDSFEPIVPSASERRRFDGLQASRRHLFTVLSALHSGGFRNERIHLLGFGQGGTVALDLVQHLGSSDQGRLGGCTAVSAHLLDELLAAHYDDGISDADVACATPILLLHGARDASAPPDKVLATVTYLQKRLTRSRIRNVMFPRAEGLITGPEETRELMTFLAETLTRVTGLEKRADIVELSAEDAAMVFAKMAVKTN
eukprot:TRINITY_DN8008_c0_g1_i1.p1 TRINITY_DN8008_c0_g1~~TRINITY_DN8008_c0_g1_i1.p1  ORF type:complete len:316 (-),score=44.80 TRINITY_DN8008_c0_g1_i1:590-1537(-)